MDELEISGKRYISSRHAAKEHRYHPDYIGQLVRSKKVLGEKVGRTWYVDAASLAAYLSEEQAPVVVKAEIVEQNETSDVSRTSDVKERETLPEIKTYRIPIHTTATVENSKRKGLVYIPDKGSLLPEIQSKRPREKREKIVSIPTLEHPVQKDRSETAYQTPSLWRILGLMVLGLVALSVSLGASHFLAYTNIVKGSESTASISLTPIEF